MILAKQIQTQAAHDGIFVYTDSCMGQTSGIFCWRKRVGFTDYLIPASGGSNIKHDRTSGHKDKHNKQKVRKDPGAHSIGNYAK